MITNDPIAYDQSERKARSGTDMKVIELSVVAKILIPAAQAGILPPALKKASVSLLERLVKYAPTSNIPTKYKITTIQFVSPKPTFSIIKFTSYLNLNF